MIAEDMEPTPTTSKGNPPEENAQNLPDLLHILRLRKQEKRGGYKYTANLRSSRDLPPRSYQLSKEDIDQSEESNTNKSVKREPTGHRKNKVKIHLSPEDWSDATCHDYARKVLIHPTIRRFEVQKQIMINFMIFYCGKEVIKYSFVATENIIVDAVYLLSAENKKYLCWSEEFYQKPSKDRGYLEGNQVWLELESVGCPHVVSGDRFETYTRQDLLNFSLEINKLKKMDTPNTRFFTLRRLVSFLALTFLRLATISTKQLPYEFAKKTFRDNVHKIILHDDSTITYSPPSTEAIKSAKGIDFNDKMIRSAIAKVIIETIYSGRTIAPMTMASFLSRGEFYGMEVLNMIYEISAHWRIKWEDLAGLSTEIVPETKHSWNNLSPILAKYDKLDPKLHSIVYSVLIDGRFFPELRMDENEDLVCLLVQIFATTPKGKGILQVKWMKNHSDQLEAMKEKGDQLFEKIKALNLKTGGKKQGFKKEEK